MALSLREHDHFVSDAAVRALSVATVGNALIDRAYTTGFSLRVHCRAVAETLSLRQHEIAR